MSLDKVIEHGANMEFTIKVEPFSWNDNFSEIALEDFSMIQKDFPDKNYVIEDGVIKIKEGNGFMQALWDYNTSIDTSATIIYSKSNQ